MAENTIIQTGPAAEIQRIQKVFVNDILYDVYPGSNVREDNLLNPQGNKIPTEKAVAEYIKTAVGDIAGAMVFLGTISREELAAAKGNAITAIKTKFPNAKVGSVVVFSSNAQEYICSGPDTWELLGDEVSFQTKLPDDSLAFYKAGSVKNLTATFAGNQYQPAGTVTTTVGTENATVAVKGVVTPNVSLTGGVSATSTTPVVTSLTNKKATVNYNYSTASAAFPSYSASVKPLASTNVSISDTVPDFIVDGEILTLGSKAGTKYTALKTVGTPSVTISKTTEGSWPTASTTSVLSTVTGVTSEPTIDIKNDLSIQNTAAQVTLSGNYVKPTGSATSTFVGTTANPGGTITLNNKDVVFERYK